MKPNKLPPIHPGEILREEFMKPRGLSQNALARALNVPPRRINEIVLEKRGITADTALRLARYFGTSAEMWTGLQSDYDLRLVRYEKAQTIDREVEPLAACWNHIPAPAFVSGCRGHPRRFRRGSGSPSEPHRRNFPPAVFAF
jgi:addiction module HigA family antidote